MVVPDVDVGRPENKLPRIGWKIVVQSRLLTVNGRVFSLLEVEVGCHNTPNHVINSRLQQCAVVDRFCQVAAEEGGILNGTKTNGT